MNHTESSHVTSTGGRDNKVKKTTIPALMGDKLVKDKTKNKTGQEKKKSKEKRCICPLGEKKSTASPKKT